jgi:hypothetical protein
MEFKAAEQWWKSKSHRGIRGARGTRTMSVKGHLLFGAAVVGFIEFLLRVDDAPMYKAPPPPVEAPPPLPTSMGYSLTSETLYLKQLETEKVRPKHVPQRQSFDFEQLREGGTFTNSTRK